MARILAYTSPGRGHLYPIVPTLDELRRRGHDIVLRTLPAEVPSMIERGFDAAPVDPAVVAASDTGDWRATSPQDALRRSVAGMSRRALVDAPDFEKALREHDPDVALVDVNSWGALAAAESWGGPWGMFCPYPLPMPSRGVPPFGPGLAPKSGLWGAMRDAALRPLVFGALERIMLPPLNEIRAQRGLSHFEDGDEVFRRPPLLLYFSAEPFEYPHPDWPHTVVSVGPCAWEPPGEIPTWLEAVDVPIILVTTSSEFQDDGRLVSTALEALGGSDVHIVATVPAGDPNDYRVPPNAHVLRFTPHGPILDRAACAVTHGGMGATQKALQRGVPVCAVPFGRDQLEVARRVEVAGAGTRLLAKKLTPDALRRKIEQAITMRSGAAEVAAGYAKAGGAGAAADAVSQLLATRITP
jgi:MGT family glycosyltransferase